MKRIIFLFTLLPTLLWGQSPLLPVEHPAYDFIDRMEVMGLVDYPLMGAKPVTCDRISQLLDEIDQTVAVNNQMLSNVDRDMLAVLRWEFSRDTERSGRNSRPAVHPDYSRWGSLNGWMDDKGWFTKKFYGNGINLYSYETEDVDLYFDPRGSAKVISQKGESDPIVITSVGFRFRGQIQDRIGLYLEAKDITEGGRGPYWDRAQLYEDRVGYVGRATGDETINYDVSNFDLSFGGKYWELHLAKMPLRWGPGQSGQLMLSDWGTSFHQVQAAFNLGDHLRLVYVLGALKTYPEIVDTLYQNAGYYRTVEAEKYIAAHRLEWNPHPRLRFGLSEAVVFGDRQPEIGYLIPVNLFYSAQHDLGDEDNILISFDGAWIPYPKYKLYGELLIDDITFGKVGSDFFGNKLGWLTGLHWMEPVGLENVDMTVEISQLRPFIYTHKYYVNVYQHWTAPLGYRYPPNSQVIYLAANYRPHRRVEVHADWVNLRHGANSVGGNAGGDINSPHDWGASDDAPFLGGVLEKSNRVNLGVNYEVLLGLDLAGGFSWIDADGETSWEWVVGFVWN